MTIRGTNHTFPNQEVPVLRVGVQGRCDRELLKLMSAKIPIPREESIIKT